jgi:autophagy-related protein 9
MIDLNAHHQYPYLKRRYHGTGPVGGSDTIGTVHFAHDPPQESAVDVALRESRLSTTLSRKRGLGGSVMGMSNMLSAGAGPALAASVFGDLSTAPSAVLGDSQGSIKLSAASTGVSKTRKEPKGSSEEMAADEGVVSGLGESYVDGTKRYVRKVEEEEESLEDGGVLGLLAQIYGRRDGPAVVM